MANYLVEIVGWIAAALLLSAYVLLTMGKVGSGSRLYQWLNVLAGAGLILNSGWNGAYPSVFINVVWMAIGLYGVFGGPAGARPERHDKAGHGLAEGNLSFDLDRQIERQFRHPDGAATVRAHGGPVELQDQIRAAVDDAGCWLKPGAELTMPNKRSHAVTRSRSPSARLRLPKIDSAVSRAAT